MKEEQQQRRDWAREREEREYKGTPRACVAKTRELGSKKKETNEKFGPANFKTDTKK